LSELMIFSSFMARPMSPLILSLPLMNADVGFSSPAIILLNASAFIVIVQLTFSANSPLARVPAPFFKSKYQSAGDASVILNA